MRLPPRALRARHDIDGARPSRPPPGGNSPTSSLAGSRPPVLRRAATHAAKASEWLLDNEFQVRRAVRQVREDMPAAFYRRLPRLAAPEYRGIPRVMALAHGMLDAAHMQVSLAGAVDFVKAYQQDGPLTIAELWAFPAMLRLACLESARSRLLRTRARTRAAIRADPRIGPTRDARPDRRRLARDFGAHGGVEHLLEGVLRAGQPGRGDPAGRSCRGVFGDGFRHARPLPQGRRGNRGPARAVSEWEVAEAALKLTRAHAAHGAAGMSDAGWSPRAGGARADGRLSPHA
jgi:cyclic beta-1,2-glucan synthetase